MGKAWFKYGRLCGTWKGRKLVLSADQPDLIGDHLTIDPTVDCGDLPRHRLPDHLTLAPRYLGKLDGYYQFRYVSGATNPNPGVYPNWNSYGHQYNNLLLSTVYTTGTGDYADAMLKLPGYRASGWPTVEEVEAANFLHATPVQELDGSRDCYLFYFDFQPEDNSGSIVYHLFKVP